ncbi:hypothetical protein Gohar_005060, partial [Gossypium harknessii]|nr:hypothetical protein [Gossypium harknessii]
MEADSPNQSREPEVIKSEGEESDVNMLDLPLSYHYGTCEMDVFDGMKMSIMKKNDEKTRGKSSTSGSAIKGFPRTVGAGSESYTIAADAFRRPISGAGVEVSPPILIDDDDIPGGIRLADARDIGFVDVVRIGYFLYRFLVDALGYWLVHGILRCWDCFRDFH